MLSGDKQLTNTLKNINEELIKKSNDLILNSKVDKVLRSKIENEEQEDSFFVCDLSEVYTQYLRWNKNLKNFAPFYAIKCNPDIKVIKLLKNLGSGFDCASKNEIKLVLSLGVDPSRIIYANPCKPSSHLRYAKSVNVQLLTFDNFDELEKIKLWHSKAKLVLRISVDDSKSVCRFGIKFGAHMEIINELISKCKNLDLELVGVSFHVGSGCYDSTAYDNAIKRSKYIFDIAKNYNYNLKVLDIGGGFPSSLINLQSKNLDNLLFFESIAESVNNAIINYFPNWKEDGMIMIAEPGRYFVSGAYTLAVNITSRRVIANNDIKGSGNSYIMYYLNDGVYGSFNCLLYDHAIVVPNVLKSKSSFKDEYECSIWGPTCDSMDFILKSTRLPLLEVGDWLYFRNMGAYTICAASEFNGFKKSSIIYTDPSSNSYSKSLIE